VLEIIGYTGWILSHSMKPTGLVFLSQQECRISQGFNV
jgi:hypothetical protein